MFNRLFLTALLCTAGTLLSATTTYRVSGRILGADPAEIRLCDGEQYHAPAPDGSFDFAFDSDGGGFLYLCFPGHYETAGKAWARLQAGSNTCNFQLRRRPAPPPDFTFIHGSDIQYDFLGRAQELAQDCAELREIMTAQRAEFITLPGDLSTDGQPEQLAALKDALEQNHIPYRAVFGGHDGLVSSPGTKNFLDCFGPPYWSWQQGGIHFIAPVSEEHFLLPGEKIRHQRWLEATLLSLPAGSQVIVVTHIPRSVAPRIAELAARQQLRILAWLGAHFHHDNLIEYAGSICNTNMPYRGGDFGNFTKKVRLIDCQAGQGIVSTRSRILNNRTRAVANLFARQELLVHLYDSRYDFQQAQYACAGQAGPLTRTGVFTWSARLSAPLPSGPQALSVQASGPDGQSCNWDLAVQNNPALLWQYSSGSLFFYWPQTAVHGDHLYLGLAGQNYPFSQGGVLCLDRHRGQKLWQSHFPDDIQAGVAANAKRLFALSNRGQVLAFNAADGTMAPPLPALLELPPGNTALKLMAPLALQLQGQYLAVHAFQDRNGYLQLYHSESLQPLWPKVLPLGGGLMYNSFALADDRLFFIGVKRYGAVSLATGEILWQDSSNPAETFPRPLPAGSEVFFRLRDVLRKCRADNGETIWECALPGRRVDSGGMLLLNGKLFLTHRNTLLALDAGSGKILQRAVLPESGHNAGFSYRRPSLTAAPVAVGNSLVLPADNGVIYQIDPGTLSWTPLLDTGFPFKAAATVAGNDFYAVGFDGVVYALRLPAQAEVPAAP
ncbi:MAG: PQQ-binding-like beta-propeller repeat protein [Oligosphaeraceae bacterium]|nr:PQQ-binding-like beta-propeller repeat protein [Oligosphaeraceae bacterium]